MKKKTIALVSILPMLLILTALTGCITSFTVYTEGWENIDTEATSVRVWGRLSIVEPADNWNEGFVWDTEKHDDINLYSNREWADNHGALNTFSLDIEDLDRATTYHYRAFAENQGPSSTIRIGVDLTFLPGQPRVATLQATDVTLTTATLNGHLLFLGGAPSCEVFFVYGDDPDYMTQETAPEVMTSTGDFSVTLTDLETCETIYFKAIAINDVGTVDGWILEVTPGQPRVETYLPSDVGDDYAILDGYLWHLGGAATCDVWFEYGDESPDNLDQSTTPQPMNAVGDFEAEVTLEPGTTYWVRAVADNGVCDPTYGSVEQFTTGGAIAQNTQITRGELVEWLREQKGRVTIQDLIQFYLSKTSS